MQRKDEIIRNINYCINCAKDRIQWYTETGSDRYLVDSSNYLSVANIFMREISNEISV